MPQYLRKTKALVAVFGIVAIKMLITASQKSMAYL